MKQAAGVNRQPVGLVVDPKYLLKVTIILVIARSNALSSSALFRQEVLMSALALLIKWLETRGRVLVERCAIEIAFVHVKQCHKIELIVGVDMGDALDGVQVPGGVDAKPK